MSLNNNYELASIALNRVIAQQKYNNDEQCSICLNSMLNQTVLHIPCGHIFHNNCINTVFKSDCLTKYNCPLCRFDIYSCLQKLGFPPLQFEEDIDNEQFDEDNDQFDEDIDNEQFDEAIDTFSDILEVIGSSFSPVCFHNIITNDGNTLCEICKDNFINLSQTSENVDISTKSIIDEYNELPNGIICLFDDIKNLINFDGNVDEYMLQIFPEYNNSENTRPH
jgi:hypothetical protein